MADNGIEKIERADDEWRECLTPEQFRVTREKGTETAFTGQFFGHTATGCYACVCCGLELFDSDAKFDSGCGWPSFTHPIDNVNIGQEVDNSFGMRRVEVLCRRCGAHLGHVFPDGPPPTGMRYCINSVALDFRPAE